MCLGRRWRSCQAPEATQAAQRLLERCLGISHEGGRAHGCSECDSLRALSFPLSRTGVDIHYTRKSILIFQ